MASITAQAMINENNWSTTDITLINLEGIIDNAINYVSLRTGISMPNLSGTAGSKTVSLTNEQSIAVKAAAILMAKGYLERGPNIGIGSTNIATLIADPQYSFWKDAVEASIKKLTELEDMDVSVG